MNKLLVAIFAAEPSADAGLNTLRRLHEAGDITLYATGVLKQEAAASAETPRLQFSEVKGAVKALIEARLERAKSAYQARGAKLPQAWSLTEEARAV
jgi:hypothetical protein